MFVARPYQTESIARLREGWANPEVKNQLLCMATGCGKTVVFSKLGLEEVAEGGRVLILAHTDELIDQAIDKFEKSTGLKADREKAAAVASLNSRVVVGSVQTMQRDNRLERWPVNHFSLIVVDEAHRSLARGYQKILAHFKGPTTKVVGVTATPDRGDNRALSEFYQSLAYDYGLRKAVEEGWLVRPIVKTMPLRIDLRGVKVKTGPEGSDLDRDEVGKRLIPILGDIAACIRADIGAGKVLIFMPSVETAGLMSDALNAAGVLSTWVCGDRKICPDRHERVAAHQAGKVQALVNMAVLTEGYDDDSIHNIVCLRATKLRSLYCQIIGRGTRPLAEIVPQLNAAPNAYERVELIKASAKPHIRILDFLWLYKKHDICTPASLVTRNEEVEEKMAGKQGDLLELETETASDVEAEKLKKLERELRRNAQKKSIIIDPLAEAALKDVDEETKVEPLSPSDALPPSERQVEILERHGVLVAKVATRRHAHLIINRIVERSTAGLCTLRQLKLLRRWGIDASNWSMGQARDFIGRKFGQKPKVEKQTEPESLLFLR